MYKRTFQKAVWAVAAMGVLVTSLATNRVLAVQRSTIHVHLQFKGRVSAVALLYDEGPKHSCVVKLCRRLEIERLAGWDGELFTRCIYAPHNREKAALALIKAECKRCGVPMIDLTDKEAVKRFDAAGGFYQMQERLSPRGIPYGTSSGATDGNVQWIPKRRNY